MNSLKYLAVRTTSTVTYRLTTYEPAPVTTTSEMHMDLSNPTEVRATGRTTTSGQISGMSVDMDVVMIGRQVYARVADAPWQEMPTDSDSGGSLNANYGADYWMDFFSAGLVRVGVEDVSGVATTHYRATGGHTADMTIESYDIWVDASWRCVKNELKATTIGSSTTLTSTAIFFDFDVPVEIVAPI